MRKALIQIHNITAGTLIEENPKSYIFQYKTDYNGPPISLTMPVRNEPYQFKEFPAFFDGLLPEGIQLEGLLKNRKIDKGDFLKQLLVTGEDLVGAVTVLDMEESDE